MYLPDGNTRSVPAVMVLTIDVVYLYDMTSVLYFVDLSFVWLAIYRLQWRLSSYEIYPWLILGLRPANERRCYFVTTSLIGWMQAQNQPCISKVRPPQLSKTHISPNAKQILYSINVISGDKRYSNTVVIVPLHVTGHVCSVPMALNYTRYIFCRLINIFSQLTINSN